MGAGVESWPSSQWSSRAERPLQQAGVWTAGWALFFCIPFQTSPGTGLQPRPPTSLEPTETLSVCILQSRKNRPHEEGYYNGRTGLRPLGSTSSMREQPAQQGGPERVTGAALASWPVLSGVTMAHASENWRLSYSQVH